MRDGEILTEGWTQKAGQAHAEAHAISRASSALTGATAYVTLEPCSHYGRTPPCTDALINAAISRVVVATADPNPRVNGEGLMRLKQAGIKVETGLLKAQARQLNRGFFSLHERFRPWVRIKTAASLDGKTAMANGQSKWITGPHARLDVHRLRAQSSAILTGVNTVIADDPSLTVRLDAVERQPLRVILDSNLKTPGQARLFDKGGEIMILSCLNTGHDRAIALKQKGANIVQIESDNGRLSLQKVMETLAAMAIGEVHVEAGRTLTGQLIGKNLADEIVIYFAPAILGDRARGMFDIPELVDLEQQKKMQWRDTRMIGKDLRLTMRLCG